MKPMEIGDHAGEENLGELIDGFEFTLRFLDFMQ